jgi:hypothetical protein
MGISLILTATILESFQIIIRHNSKSGSPFAPPRAGQILVELVGSSVTLLNKHVLLEKLRFRRNLEFSE